MKKVLNRSSGILYSVFCASFGIIGLSTIIISVSLLKLSSILDLGYLSIVNKYRVLTFLLPVMCIVISVLIFIIRLKKLEKRALKVKFAVFIVAVVMGLSYATFCFLLYIFQDELVYRNQIVFQTNTITREYADTVLEVNKDTEEIHIKTPDNVMLHGWLLKNSNEKKLPLLIYFGGSAEEVSNRIEFAKTLEGWSVALLNYRGYGLSQGVPSQDNLFKDAKLIYDYFARRSDIETDKIYTMGYSLGTGVAVNLSCNRPIKGVILAAPFDKYVNANHLQAKVPYIPLSIIFKQSFNSILYAPKVKVPLLCIVSDSDRIVPIDSSKRLVNSWGGNHKVKVLKGIDHNYIVSNDECWSEIKSFLKDN